MCFPGPTQYIFHTPMANIAYMCWKCR